MEFKIILVVILNLIYCESANILIFLPLPGYSHFKPMQPLYKELAKRGHNVTVVSMFPLKENISNYTDIYIPFYKLTNFNFAELHKRKYIWWKWIMSYELLQNITLYVLRQDVIKQLLKSKDTKFDLILVELYHLDSFFALGSHFNAPVIGLSFLPILSHYDWIFRNPNEFLHTPHPYSSYSDCMNFSERIINHFLKLFSIIFYNFVSIPQYQKQVDELLQSSYYGFDNRIRKIEDISKNISLVLMESHFSIDFVKSKLPNIIDVGGIHIELDKTLPKDLKNFMDNAASGVIYFSLGSLMDPSHLKTISSKFSKIFRKLNYSVIWKWKPELLDNIPKNVLVREWLPQIDILNHPNCVLFISHGGYHSLIETVHFGLPMLVIPLFNDQYYNAALIEKFSIGKRSSLETSADEFIELIRELTENKKYRENAKQQSKIYKDRPQSPLDTAVYWTEYVIRHKGAPHLKSAAADLYWYQYIYLDIILFYIFVIFITYIIIHCFFISLYKFFKLIFNKSKIKLE